MSRGHGVQERRVLESLRRHETVCMRLGAAGTYLPIAAIADEGAPRSQVESVRRACKTLAKAGLLDLTRAAGPSSPLLARLSVEDGIDVSTGQRLAPVAFPWQ